MFVRTEPPSGGKLSEAKTTVSDAKTSFSRLAKSENPQFTVVNEEFSDERNAENGVFAQRLLILRNSPTWFP